MRVRATEATRAYWNYSIHTLAAGEEVEGELALHLWCIAAPVEIVGGEPPAAPQPADPSATADGPAGDSDEPAEPGEEPPVDGTIDTLMTWVGNDPARAEAALAAEQAKDNPRVTAVKHLTAIAEAAAETE